MDIFGFEINRKKQEKEELKRQSFVPRENDDGSTEVVSAGGHFGQLLDLTSHDDTTDSQLIIQYRQMSNLTECDAAIEDIINEAIVADDTSVPVRIVMDDADQSDKVKKLVSEEFNRILELLNFNWYAHDTFRKWYVDGRLYYHKILDKSNPKRGIVELRPIDPTRIQKIREVEEKTDEKTGAKIITKTSEYFLYQDSAGAGTTGLKISKDAVAYITSGLLDPSRTKVLSYLHKAIKSANQLGMMEDALVIYRVSRAPERRIFYIDVGNLPKSKAEAYVNGIMNKYRNKLVYDANTGNITDEKKHMSILEDFWLPRREGGRGTEIDTLSGGENLGQIDDILYFQKKLYRSLNVPLNRLEQESTFSVGRATEITRDEIKFNKFITRLRKRFSMLFVDLLKTQLVLKGILTESEFDEFKSQINFDFIEDNHFSEMKDAELLRERIGTLTEMDEFVGRYYSVKWIRKNVLRQTDEDIEEIDQEIDDEGTAEEYEDPDIDDDNDNDSEYESLDNDASLNEE